MVTSNLKEMVTNEDAVSPVIGVILMVAVTVVLAAVIGAFVFGIGDSLGEPAPNAQINFDYDADSNNVEVLHDGGDGVNEQNTGTLTVTGDLDADDVAEPGDVWGDDMDETAGDSDLVASPTAAHSAGDSFFNTANDDDSATENIDGAVTSGDSLELQWESSGGDQSSTLGTFEAP